MLKTTWWRRRRRPRSLRWPRSRISTRGPSVARHCQPTPPLSRRVSTSLIGFPGDCQGGGHDVGFFYI